MLTALERLPFEESSLRLQRCRQIMGEDIPESVGLLIFSSLNIYYLTGTLGLGVLWVPKEGEPVLCLYRGIERAKLESSFRHLYSVNTFSDVAAACAEAGSPFSSAAAIEKRRLSLAAAESLFSQLPDLQNAKSCDEVLDKARSVKSEWELKKLRICGERHRYVLEELLPQNLTSDTSEFEIARRLWSQFLERGHQGIIRFNDPNAELFLGHVSAGASGCYPSYADRLFTGRGVHPAVPFMGDAGAIWKRHTALSIDARFTLEGYHTVKTQTYWAGDSSAIPEKLKQAQEVCADIYERALSTIAPGVSFEEVWRAAWSRAQSTKIPGTFMGIGNDTTCFLGNGVGLAVDEPPLFEKRSRALIEEGMVLTIGPKVSVPGLGSVGVEHTLEITAEGASSLTGSSLGIISVE